MKYVVIIPDGGADFPLDELAIARDGEREPRTPLEAAATPNLDRLAAIGRVGVAHTTPEGFEAGSDVCSMSLLGYDPRKYHTGRAPLEAAALGLRPGPTDYIFRVNLVTTGFADGRPSAEPGTLMLDHSAGAITDREARRLITDLFAYWRRQEPEMTAAMTLTPGVSYRNILVDAGGRDYSGAKTIPPHAVPGEPWEQHLPAGERGASFVLKRLMELSASFLPGHEVNLARVEQGLRPATMAWIWGQGVKPVVPSFQERFGVKGVMITAVDLLAGISAFIGWERLLVPGMTSYHDTDYKAQGKATCEAIRTHDIVCSHIESPDESSHQGDWKTKVAALEAIDREIVGPVMRELERLGDPEQDPDAEGWRILVLPDHYTLVSTRKHDATPVPFLMAGAWVKSMVKRPFTEAAANESDLRIAHGHDLMEYFLKGGLVNVRGRTKRA